MSKKDGHWEQAAWNRWTSAGGTLSANVSIPCWLTPPAVAISGLPDDILSGLGGSPSPGMFSSLLFSSEPIRLRACQFVACWFILNELNTLTAAWGRRLPRGRRPNPLGLTGQDPTGSGPSRGAPSAPQRPGGRTEGGAAASPSGSPVPSLLPDFPGRRGGSRPRPGPADRGGFAPLSGGRVGFAARLCTFTAAGQPCPEIGTCRWAHSPQALRGRPGYGLWTLSSAGWGCSSLQGMRWSL